MFTRLNVLILIAITLIDFLFLSIFLGGAGTIVIILSQIISGGVGIFFIKKLGSNLLFYADATIKKKEPIVKEFWGEIFLLIGAYLLAIPGFLTDIIGIVLFIPDSRKLILDFIDN